MKVQLVIDRQSTEVVHLAFSNGKTHDFALFEQHCDNFSPEVHFYADSGYEGLDKLFPNSFTPYKKTKNKVLTAVQKTANQVLSSIRVGVEHVIRSFKKFRILSSVYRNRHDNLDLRTKIIASFHNSMLKNVINT